jgi:hypothetical protein
MYDEYQNYLDIISKILLLLLSILKNYNLSLNWSINY